VRQSWFSIEKGWRIAAFAALGSTGKYRAKELHYDIVADWATGMAVMEGLN